MIWNDFPDSEKARMGAAAMGLGGPMTRLVKWLLISNVAIFVLSLLAAGTIPFMHWFGMVPTWVAKGAIWQLFTYLFLHAGPMHLLLNLLGLWIFGGEIEQSLGIKRFAWLYAISGVGAGLCALALGWGSTTPLVGASGAIYGILMTYALLWPRRPITLLVFFILPVTLEARWMVAIFGGIQLLTLISGGDLGQAAHLGGLLFGFLFMMTPKWIQRLQTQRAAQTRVVQFKTKTQLEDEQRKAQEEVNALLDKALREGEGALTADEQERLVAASRKLKGKEF